MRFKELEKTIFNFLFIGVPLVSVTVFTSGANDPVNVTKLFVLGCLATGIGSLTILKEFRSLLATFKWEIVLTVLFTLTMVNSLIFSNAPTVQNLYGVFGRSTGFLTYLALVFIMLAAFAIKDREHFRLLMVSFFTVGIINEIYCAWVIFFGDPIGWENPYKNILGLLGNPDFISAFLGMIVVALFAVALAPTLNYKRKVFVFVPILIGILEIKSSHAIQGLVITVGGFCLVVLVKIFFFLKNKWLILPPVLILMIFGALAILGTLQKGPLSFVYKRSVSFRGTYWKTALEMGSSRPLHGVGMDTYGDFYKQARPPIALIDTPGINTGSNVAHNVFLDFFANGGWPLFISYIALTLVGFVAILRIIKRSTTYDWIFVSLAVAWIGYQVQSIISINQIGLTIWGWLFTGMLVALDRSSRSLEEATEPRVEKKRSKNNSSGNQVFSTSLVAGIGVIVGILIYLPPLNADLNWRSALVSRNVVQVEKALEPTYMNPASTWKYTQAFALFVNSNLPEQAHKYALKSVKFNPDSFESWKGVYLSVLSTELEKARALKNMKRLDPLNPDVTLVK